MSDPIPKNIAFGSLDMTLRDILIHMLEIKNDHAVIIIPNSHVRLGITVAPPEKMDRITHHVAKILGERD